MLNNSAYEFISKQCKVLEDFIFPLRIHGISYFSFARIYHTGKIIFLCNHQDWLTIKTDQKLYDFKGFIPDDVENEIINNYNYHIYTGLGYQENRVLKLLYETNRWNSIDLYNRNREYLDIIHFAGTKDNIGIINFYLNNLGLLQCYFNHFKTQFEEIIQLALKNKFYVEISKTNVEDKFILNPSLFQFNNVDNFQEIQTIELLSKFPKMTFKTNTQNVDITKRENVCMFLLSTGKSYKEIGQILHISDRTVEQHLNNIKSKTGFNYKAEIINFFSNNLGRYAF